MQDVATWLSTAGVTLPTGWTLNKANGANTNGSVLVGEGTDPAGHTEAWLARVGPQGSGILLDIPAYNATLIEAGARAARSGIDLPNLALFGAHHRSLLDSGLARTANGTCAWATADAAGYNSTSNHMQLTEAGVCKDIDSTRLGLGVGQAWAQQDWSLGGDAKYDGQYLIAEVANAFGNGMEGSVTGYYGQFSTDLRRHYMNGANVDTSNAKPDAKANALRLRLDWKDLTSLGQFSLSPYATFTWSETKLDAYTENGGGFPAQFAAAKWTTNDLRIGAVARTALSGASDLRLGLEAVHRLEGSTSGVNGQVIGLWGFSLPGQSETQSWARATVDIDHRLSNATLLTVGANAATTGSDASWGVTLGIRANF
jgi:Autotransporter beta-domain